MVLEAVILASSLSLDAFLASFAYGSNKIKLPLVSVMVIDFVCGGFLGFSMLLGNFVRPFLPSGISSLACFIILFAIGLVKLLDNITKSAIRRHSGISKDIHFSLMNLKFILSIYADPEKSDVDESKSISAAEAFSLAVALSLDGMAAGFGAVLGNVNGMAVFLASLATGAAAVFLGDFLGNKVADSLKFNISWLSGAVLIVMAFMKIM